MTEKMTSLSWCEEDKLKSLSLTKSAHVIEWYGIGYLLISCKRAAG